MKKTMTVFLTKEEVQKLVLAEVMTRLKEDGISAASGAEVRLYDGNEKDSAAAVISVIIPNQKES